MGPLLIGKGNVVSLAGGLVMAGGGAANLYQRLPAKELPTLMNRRFKADYVSSGAVPAGQFQHSSLALKHIHRYCMLPPSLMLCGAAAAPLSVAMNAHAPVPPSCRQGCYKVLSCLTDSLRDDALHCSHNSNGKGAVPQPGGLRYLFEGGYWGDTGLEMRVRQAGLDVILQPPLVVYHQEGGTLGGSGEEQLRRIQLMASNGAAFHIR